MRVACLILLAAVLGASDARADISACTSGYMKDSLDDQIRLFTICLKSGGLRPGEISWAFGSRGAAYLRKGEIDLAIADFTKAIQYDPKYALAYYNRSIGHLYRGDLAAADTDLTDAIARPPSRIRAEAHGRRGVVRMYQGRCPEALADLDVAVKKDRKMAWAHGARGWLLATCAEDSVRNGAEALKSAQNALSLQDHWKVRDTLAAAHAELGQFEESVRELKLALSMLATEAEDALLRRHLEERLALYEMGQPYRERPSGTRETGEWVTSVF